MGNSSETAKLLGISEEKIVLFAMFLSGGLAGFAGVGEVAGIHHLLRHPDHISLGYGYTAIIVAWIGSSQSSGYNFYLFLFGALLSGGDALRVSLVFLFRWYRYSMDLFSFLISTERLSRYRIIWGRRKRWREVALELVLGTLNQALAYGILLLATLGNLCRGGRGSKSGDRE